MIDALTLSATEAADHKIALLFFAVVKISSFPKYTCINGFVLWSNQQS